MGPNETVIVVAGAPRVISLFDGSGCCRAQIKHFLGAQIGSRAPHGLGLIVSRRLYRIRMRFGHPIALKAVDQRHGQIMLWGARLPRDLVYMIQAPVWAV